MKPFDIACRRLQNQQIVASTMKSPAAVVAHFGAMQSQDYAGAKWSIGLRLPGASEASIEQALANKTIVRSWPLRSTLHFVAAKDIRWMMALTGPRTIASHQGRYKQLELDEATLERGVELLMKALQGGTLLDRPALLSVLENNRIVTSGQRGIYILERACQEGLICQGATVRGKATYFEIASLPATPPKTREEALAELTKRYFTSHGPATLADFVWWSGLKISDARIGIELVKNKFESELIDGQTYLFPKGAYDSPPPSPDIHLLPGFDEFLLAYKERSASLEPGHKPKWSPGNNGVFFPLIIIDGRVAGIWKRIIKKDKIIITPHPFAPMRAGEKAAFTKAARRYGLFLGLPIVVEW